MDRSRGGLILLLIGCFTAFSSIVGGAQSGRGGGAIQYYVAADGDDSNPGTMAQPFGSLQQAQRSVRAACKEGLKCDVEVIIRGGDYELSEPLVFGPDDSGTIEYSITYAGYPRERAVVSGGRAVTNWKRVRGGLWAAEIHGGGDFQQFYVNDERAVRARTPNADADPPRWHLASADYEMPPDRGLPTALSMTLSEGRLWKWSNIEDVQVVVFKDWATFRKQVDSVDPSRRRVELKGPFVRPPTGRGKHNSLYTRERQKGYTCYFEGSPDMIDRPGEWAFNRDKSRLEYSPRPGEDIDELSAIQPVASQLLVVAGAADKPVQNLHFRDLWFAYCGYDLPDRGHDGRQAVGFYCSGWEIPPKERILPAAIEWRFARNCSFCGCRVSHVGANGVSLLDGCQGNIVEGNRISDIGGNCIMLGTDSDPGSTSQGRVRRNTVANNWVHRGGRDYPSAVGVWLGFTRSCAVSHNRIHDLPYSGISVGWQWNDEESWAANNRIEYNYIFDVMKELGDGGAIYTLGYQPLTVLRGNHIHSVRRSELNAASPNNGFFFDEGSKGYLVEKNIVYDTAFSPLRGHRARGILVRGNILSHGRLEPVLYCSPPYDRPLTLRSNGTLRYDGEIVMTLEDNEIYAEREWRRVGDEKIMQARKTAGLEREFRKLLME